MVIQVLPADVAAKIAAGEVVERPANVVKELLENSLDAGATEIRVELREGGQRLLRVTDNGHGILAADAPLAFLRHATSKLSTVEDLTQIATFGFRGEALYSIAAVSQVTLTSRHHSEAFATQLRIEGGEMVSQQRVGAPVGTIVTVEQLFYNVPARQKFLRKPATEAGRIADLIQRFALAHPDRRFSLAVDGRLVFQSAGTGDLFDVLVKIYGLEQARQMVPIGDTPRPRDQAHDEPPLEEWDFMGDVDTSHTMVTPRAAPVSVQGYVSLPTLTRPNRGEIQLFVNRRQVEDRTLTYAVIQAYHTLLPVGRYPMAVILIEVDPAEVDVNVHPQKSQVRFVEERAIFRAVQKAVRYAVTSHAPPPELHLSVGQAPTSEAAGQWQPLPSRPEPAPLPFAQPSLPGQQSLDIVVPELEPTYPPVVDAQPAAPLEAEQPVQTSLIAGRKHGLPMLRVVGQVGALYIIAEGPEGMYLIDQHAAHERILYEKFMRERANDTVAQQQLLQPLTLHVGTALAGLVAQNLAELQLVGFAIEPFGSDTFLVRAVPSVLSGQDPLRALEEMVTTLGDQRNLVGEAREARLVKMICKRAAIKAGQLLSALEMQELVRQLEECESPRTCPHGRPTLIQLAASELEKAFGRA